MSQSLSQIYLHIVYSTKHRAPFLKDRDVRDGMHAYLAGICNGQDCPAIIVGGFEDHVHILCRFGKSIAVSVLLRELKRDSSKWAKTRGPFLGDFHRQGGYGAFSVSPSHVEALIEYIRNQEEHHKTESFQDEFRRLCRIYGVELDEAHAWD